ncbi:hypothetical protein INR49_007851 [Caranx melampygus]|nr:hypothetical protein INR49_007851 [Caranx melampygus]
MDEPVIVNPQVINCLHQSTDPNSFKKAYYRETDSLHPLDAESSQTGRLLGENQLPGSVRRLKRAARQCWIRLASEGVQSILLSPWQCQSIKVKGQAWGCVSLSDVLLLVEVKYDVITHLLYTEMLQEHHTLYVWESLLPWQQHKEEEELEDLAEEALESDDMLCLAELPGAFRIYRLDWESLRLLCLYIRIATLRAQREKLSYSALLAARQSWDTWPHVSCPNRAEQAALWLHNDEEGQQNEDLISLSPQQAVLQLLVLTQEQERKYLVKLVHGVSVEDLQGTRCKVPQKEESDKETLLRNGCIKRLKQIHASLQTQNETETPLEGINSQPQSHTCSNLAVWSQNQLEECAMLLLNHFMELQELQASKVPLLLMNKSAQHLQALRDEFESELQAQRYTSLLQLLTTDIPLTSSSTENRSKEQTEAQSCSTGAVEAQNICSGVCGDVSVREETKDKGHVEQVAGVTDKQDVCAGCGIVMEEVPYLEILCVYDTASKTNQGLTAEGGPLEEEEGSVTKSQQSYEKQGSLITLAWSKPPEDDYDTETARGGTGQSQDSDDSLSTQVQPSDISSTVEYTQCEKTSGESHDEELKPTLIQSRYTGHHDAQAAEKQCSTGEQLTLEERTAIDPPERDKAESGCGLGTQSLLMQTLPHLFTHPAETGPHADDICSGLTDEMAQAGRDGVEVEICPSATESELWDRRRPEPTHAAGQKYSLQSDFQKSERAREPVSAMERERTMRNLVDMQRKGEQRQQRDRERQLLRVQERLSIVQNRKAEEDLLGLKHTDRLKHVTQDLPQEDKNQQKTVVRERLEQLRRERSYVMQSKRDRNTAVFKELLGPVAVHRGETEEGE